MLRYLISLAVGWSAVLGSAAVAAAVEAPKVVVSIKPLHSLVAGVMGEVGAPTLLVKGAGSPHSYALRPSEARALSEADLVVWIGPELEQFLVKPIDALAGRATVVGLAEADGISLLETREGGAWQTDHDNGHADEHDHEDHADEHAHEEHADEHDHEDHADEAHADEHGHDHAHGEHDMHLWLDPNNAKAIVAAAVEALSARDPENAAIYQDNGAKMAARIDALDAELGAELVAIKNRPYVVFHDAYPYFEQHYGLNPVGAITVNPERAPGAKRLAELRDKIGSLSAVCVFSEPQFEPAIVETLVAGLPVKTGVLDPLGSELPQGESAYFDLMHGLADALVACLEPTS